MNSLQTLEGSLKILLRAYYLFVSPILIHHWELLLQLYQDGNLSKPPKITFCEKLTQMHLAQYPDSSVVYRERFSMNTGNINATAVDDVSSISQQSMSSSLTFDSVGKVFLFLLWMIQKFLAL